MLKNINIGARLLISFLFILILFISLSIFGLLQMKKLSDQTTKIFNHPMRVSNAVFRIDANIIKIHRTMKDIVLEYDLNNIEHYSEIVDELEQKIFYDFEIIDTYFLGDKKKYHYAYDLFKKWKVIRDEVIELTVTGERKKAIDITKGKGALHILSIEQAIEELENFAQFKAQYFLNITRNTINFSYITIILLLVMVVIIVTTLSLIITRSIISPLSKLQDGIEKIGNGNLDVVLNINSKDEIGILTESFNKMVKDLKEVTISRNELNKEIIERIKAEKALLISKDELQASLIEKEVLLKEVHHRVKNNMAIIISFLKLQSYYSKNQKFQDMIGESQKRIRAMAMIHEKLYQNKDLSTVSASDYLKTLITEIINSYNMHGKNVNLDFHVQDIRLDLDTLIPCGLIVNELITNSLKYAFKDVDNPTISVILILDNNSENINFKICDNGRGVLEDIDIKQRKTLGLSIVYQLSEQLKGNINFQTKNGVCVEINFKYKR